jgi:hypothetical protein
VRPRRQWVPMLVHQQHLRIFTTLAEIVGSIDREKHRLPFGSIRPVLVPIELDEPKVVLTNDDVPRVQTTRNDLWMKLGLRHGTPLLTCPSMRMPPALICSLKSRPQFVRGHSGQPLRHGHQFRKIGASAHREQLDFKDSFALVIDYLPRHIYQKCAQLSATKLIKMQSAGTSMAAA